MRILSFRIISLNTFSLFSCRFSESLQVALWPLELRLDRSFSLIWYRPCSERWTPKGMDTLLQGMGHLAGHWTGLNYQRKLYQSIDPLPHSKSFHTETPLFCPVCSDLYLTLTWRFGHRSNRYLKIFSFSFSDFPTEQFPEAYFFSPHNMISWWEWAFAIQQQAPIIPQEETWTWPRFDQVNLHQTTHSHTHHWFHWPNSAPYQL